MYTCRYTWLHSNERLPVWLEHTTHREEHDTIYRAPWVYDNCPRREPFSLHWNEEIVKNINIRELNYTQTKRMEEMIVSIKE